MPQTNIKSLFTWIKAYVSVFFVEDESRPAQKLIQRESYYFGFLALIFLVNGILSESESLSSTEKSSDLQFAAGCLCALITSSLFGLADKLAPEKDDTIVKKYRNFYFRTFQLTILTVAAFGIYTELTM